MTDTTRSTVLANPLVPQPAHGLSGSQTTTLVMLAAGRARRFGGCKPLARVGLHDEAIVDFIASDALDGGFDRIVIVLNRDTGPEIRRHIESTWPASVPVEFCEQRDPRGTVDAVISARDRLSFGNAFGVANADDMYGVNASSLLADYIKAANHGDPMLDVYDHHALVAFHLGATLVKGDPVTRGVCALDGERRLIALSERRQVAVEANSGTITTGDDLYPRRLPVDLWTSMNFWGFLPSIWPILERAMRTFDPATTELLLPEVVGSQLNGTSPNSNAQFRVLCCEHRCIGVTHSTDLPAVRAEIVAQIKAGNRREQLWSKSQSRRDDPIAVAQH